MELPLEILQEIFTYVPFKDLNNLELVCKKWQSITGENIWKRHFNLQFGTLLMSPLSPRFMLWRNEFLMRRRVLSKWKKCRKEINMTVGNTLGDVSDIMVNFSTDNCQALCFNAQLGLGNAIDLRHGRMLARFYSRTMDHLRIASRVDMSKFAILNGFYDGRVSICFRHRDGALITETEDMKYQHGSIVSAVWLAKTRKLRKHIRRAVAYASGDTDGTVILTSALGIAKAVVTDSPVVFIEGCMYGSNSSVDGDYLVSLHRNGELYRHEVFPSESDDPKAEPRVESTQFANLKFSDFAAQSSKLFLCNGYAIVQIKTAIYVIDIKTQEITPLMLPPRESIIAFDVDRSYTPGLRFMIAGLSNNTVRTWYLPSDDIQETPVSQMNPKVVKPQIRENAADSGTPSSPKPTGDEQHSTISTPSIESKFVNPKPLWVLDNPTGQMIPEGSAKYHITQVALNAAVALVAGYNGLVNAFDVLNGTFLSQVNSRFPRNSIQFILYSQEEFAPITHLLIDPNPLVLRGVVSMKPTIQTFHLGKVEEIRAAEPPPKSLSLSICQKKSPVKTKSSNTTNSVNPRSQLREELRIYEVIERERREAEELQNSLRERYGTDALDGDEQMSYAMMISSLDSPNWTPDRNRIWTLEPTDSTSRFTRTMYPTSMLRRAMAEREISARQEQQSSMASFRTFSEIMRADRNIQPEEAATAAAAIAEAEEEQLQQDLSMALALSLQLNDQ